jgi:hypothetical protein
VNYFVRPATLRVLLLLAFLAPARLALAQTTATVTGHVTDSDRAAVSGAAVELRDISTGLTVTTMTADDGRYNLPNLRPGGPYAVSVRALGFAEATREVLYLAIGQTLRLDFELTTEPIELEGLQVEVRPDPVFDPGHMGAETVIDKETVTKLPSLSRDFTEFAVLSPHVKVDDERISVAGQNDRFNAIQIDGALSQDVFGLESSLPGGQANAKPIPLDAIEQYEVLVAPFDIRQSGFTGGVLNAVTRSGTNRWRGSAFGFYRDENFIGNLTVDDVSQKPKTLENYLFGLTFGGTLQTDRVHLFAAAELERRRSPTIGFNLGTDDPVRASLSPDSAQRYVDILGDVYGLDAGDYTVVTLPNDLGNVFARLDVQLDPANRFVLRHNFVSARNEPGPNREPYDAYELSSYATTVDHKSNSTVFQLLSRLSPKLSNEFLGNFQMISDRVDPLSTYPRVEVDITSDLDGFELTRRVRSGAELDAQANALDQDIIQVSDNLTAAVGRGQILFGVSGEYFRIRRLFLPGSLGAYQFNSLADLEANLPARYDIVVPSSNVGDPAVRFSVLQLAAYAQREETALDERLTLRYGIRADFPLILDQPRANPEVEQVFGLRTDRMPAASPLFSWRVGFNWRLGAERRTQLRGGVGTFTGRPPFVWLSNAYANTGLQSVSLTCLGANAPGLDPSGPPPLQCLDGSGPETAGTPTINLFDPDFRFPQDLKISLGLDQDLPLGLVGSVEWLYTKAMNQIALEDLNIGERVADPQHEDGYSDGFGYQLRYQYGTPTVDGFAPNRVSDAFGPVVLVTNRASNYAWTLSFQLRREFEGRAGISAAYSYNRSGDTQSLSSSDATANFGLNPVFTDPNDPDLRPGTFDRPHKIVVSAWARLFEQLGGTEITLIYVGQSGRAYTYVYADDVNGDGYPGGGRLLDYTNDPVYVPYGPSDIPASIATQGLMEQLIGQEECLANFREALQPRNACRTPWSDRLDLRIAQNLRTGRGTVQITFDLLNALNLLNDGWGRIETITDPTIPLLRFNGRVNETGEMRPVIPQDPMEVIYAGPVRLDPETGLATAALPYSPAVPGSQWQAQLGLRVTF